jgi:hypothetical protein
MRRICKVILLAFTIYSNRSAEEYSNSYTSYYNGFSYAFRLTDNEVAKSVWKASSAAPKLSPRKAIGLASDVLKGFGYDPRDWTMKSVCLEAIGPERCLYLVSFRAPLPEEGVVGRIPVISIPVLLDGTTKKGIVKKSP